MNGDFLPCCVVKWPDCKYTYTEYTRSLLPTPKFQVGNTVNVSGDISPGKIVHGTTGKGRIRLDLAGERNANAELTERDVWVIRRLIDDGHTQRYVADLFGVTLVAIHYVYSRRNWSHVL